MGTIKANYKCEDMVILVKGKVTFTDEDGKIISEQQNNFELPFEETLKAMYE